MTAQRQDAKSAIILIMRIYLIGNGASLACGQNTGRNFFSYGLDESRHTLIGFPEVRNARNQIRAGLETLLQRYDETFNLTIGNSQGVYQCPNLNNYRQYAWNQVSGTEELSIRTSLENILTNFDMSRFVEHFYAIANDPHVHQYHSIAQKRLTLLGPHSGNFLDNLEDLQRDITGLALHAVPTPNIFDDFVKLLVKETDACIVSLNWDSLLERAYRDYTKFEPNHIFLPGHLHIHGNQTSGTCALSKPHGSVEYLRCQSPAHASWNGCFHLTVVPSMWNFPSRSATIRQCLNPTCTDRSHTLLPFIHPYARAVRSRRSSPYIAMSLEALKPIIFKAKEIISIGYSFPFDSDGWVDEDLLPIFLGKKIHILSGSASGARSIASRIMTTLALPDVNPLEFSGFKDYVAQSTTTDRLLP